MSTDPFVIGADGIDVDRVVEDIRRKVDAKMQAGAYADVQPSRTERYNLAAVQKEGDYFDLYMESLQDVVFVDINDFDIRERRAGMGPLLVLLKKTIWKLLKFYTYRLWSQQNQVNGLLLSTAQEIDRQYRDRIKKLEERVAFLERTHAP